MFFKLTSPSQFAKSLEKTMSYELKNVMRTIYVSLKNSTKIQSLENRVLNLEKLIKSCTTQAIMLDSSASTEAFLLAQIVRIQAEALCILKMITNTHTHKQLVSRLSEQDTMKNTRTSAIVYQQFKDPNNKLLKNKLHEWDKLHTTYMKDLIKEKFRVFVCDGRLYRLRLSKKNMQLELSPYITESNNMIVVDKHGNMFSSGPISGVKHSSFLSGQDVFFAGRICTNAQGNIIMVTNDSGHYQTPIEHTMRFIHRLAEMGALSHCNKLWFHNSAVWGFYSLKNTDKILKEIETNYRINSHTSFSAWKKNSYVRYKRRNGNLTYIDTSLEKYSLSYNSNTLKENLSSNKNIIKLITNHLLINNLIPKRKLALKKVLENILLDKRDLDIKYNSTKKISLDYIKLRPKNIEDTQFDKHPTLQSNNNSSDIDNILENTKNHNITSNPPNETASITQEIKIEIEPKVIHVKKNSNATYILTCEQTSPSTYDTTLNNLGSSESYMVDRYKSNLNNKLRNKGPALTNELDFSYDIDLKKPKVTKKNKNEQSHEVGTSVHQSIKNTSTPDYTSNGLRSTNISITTPWKGDSLYLAKSLQIRNGQTLYRNGQKIASKIKKKLDEGDNSVSQSKNSDWKKTCIIVPSASRNNTEEDNGLNIYMVNTKSIDGNKEKHYDNYYFYYNVLVKYDVKKDSLSFRLKTNNSQGPNTEIFLGEDIFSLKELYYFHERIELLKVKIKNSQSTDGIKVSDLRSTFGNADDFDDILHPISNNFGEKIGYKIIQSHYFNKEEMDSLDSNKIKQHFSHPITSSIQDISNQSKSKDNHTVETKKRIQRLLSKVEARKQTYSKRIQHISRSQNSPWYKHIYSHLIRAVNAPLDILFPKYTKLLELENRLNSNIFELEEETNDTTSTLMTFLSSDVSENVQKSSSKEYIYTSFCFMSSRCKDYLEDYNEILQDHNSTNSY